MHPPQRPSYLALLALHNSRATRHPPQTAGFALYRVLGLAALQASMTLPPLLHSNPSLKGAQQ